MKRDLVAMLCCPGCEGDLTLQEEVAERVEIERAPEDITFEPLRGAWDEVMKRVEGK